jgi:isopenicillin-N epimerase
MPEFGRSLRSEWLLDPDVTYLNHGTVGATPRRVLEHQRAIVDEIERQPARFLLRELADHTGTATGERRLRTAAEAVGEFVGVPGGELVFVENITSAANAVLRSFPFATGDEIAVTNLGYGGVTNAATYVARVSGAELRTISLPLPGAPRDAYVDAIAAGLGARTRVLVVDHLTSSTALVLPVAEIAAVCHERGVLVFADGAHVPGNIAVDIDALGVDWYAANLHKWAWAPRSSGILWVAEEHRATVHPAVISWGLDNGLQAEFDIVGTRDPSAFLAAPFAIDLLRAFGGDDGVQSVYRYNHDLARWAGAFLAERWGTAFSTPDELLGAMVAVPLPATLGTDAVRVQTALDGDGIEVPVLAGADGLSVRVSAQVYCGREDVEQLADAVDLLA